MHVATLAGHTFAGDNYRVNLWVGNLGSDWFPFTTSCGKIIRKRATSTNGRNQAALMSVRLWLPEPSDLVMPHTLTGFGRVDLRVASIPIGVDVDPYPIDSAQRVELKVFVALQLDQDRTPTNWLDQVLRDDSLNAAIAAWVKNGDDEGSLAIIPITLSVPRLDHWPSQQLAGECEVELRHEVFRVVAAGMDARPVAYVI